MVQTVMGTISRKAARRLHTGVAGLMLGSLFFTSPAFGQATVTTAPAAKKADAGVAVPAEYVIGPEDVLGINFWREAEMTGDVTVRPDGRITLPLIGDVQASGLTPAT